MAGLDSFKISQAIKPVGPTARALNKVVDLLSTGLVGQNGVKVTVSEGRILFEFDAKTAPTTAPGNGGGSSSTSATELHASSGSNSVDITASAISTTNGSASFSVSVSSGAVTITNLGTGNYLQIDPSLINHNLTVREIDVCDSGVAKKMLILGSAPY